MYEYEVEIRGAGHQVHSLHYKSFAFIQRKIWRLDMTILTKEELEISAKNNLGEEKTTIERDLQTLRDWINKSRHLQNIRKGE